MQGRSVLDEAIAGSGRVGNLHHELEALQHDMSDPGKADDMDRILDRFGHVQEEYEHLGGYALESKPVKCSTVWDSKMIRLTATWALSRADGKCALRWHGFCSECRMYC
jgi:hypothetical protein